MFEAVTIAGSATKQHVVVRHALLFVAGFTLIFVVEGASASALGAFLANDRNVIARFLGALLVVLGLNMLGLFRLRFLAMDRRLRLRAAGYPGSFLAGIGFAAGWTPCIGPVLSAVLAMAASTETVQSGTGLLFVYSMGLALPFVALAIAFQSVLPAFAHIRRFLPLIEAVAGLLVIATGVVLITNSFVRVLGWFYAHFPALVGTGFGPEVGSGSISVGAAFLAGLVSCISPCVFPVLPAYLSVITGQTFEQLAGAQSA